RQHGLTTTLIYATTPHKGIRLRKNRPNIAKPIARSTYVLTILRCCGLPLDAWEMNLIARYLLLFLIILMTP
ncbi:hypothetical protein, partial [Ralstonia solanacearum]